MWLLAPLVLGLSSCATSNLYRQNTMFRLPEGTDTLKLRKAVNRAEQQYRIRPNDYLEVRVYTNKGERILDPNGELQFGNPGGLNSGSGATSIPRITPSTGGGGGISTGSTQQAPGNSEFLVQADGQVKLPMVDMVKVAGLTLLEADSLLQVRYTKYYKDVYVATRVTNNRVIVLGSPGGRIVPLLNENMNLLEVLAAVGGIGGGGQTGGSNVTNMSIGRADNIRLIRGDLKNPQVQVIDLTTIEGMRRANLQVEPNDVIYIDPVRQPFTEGFRDVLPYVTTALTLFTTYLLIIRTF
ncbi:polysaccharide biosynthesis/export family protein [Hymenobacter sp. CRA2]|uniref:polysaccharide biosynthesis/export family protein n=1 Tax=Hymenobacter sp. CRA2 TaxID=1955620 RepID=UPI0020C9ECD6|nr:polysaccharide biosynthesis/export family protein [Hymenobacter sp. CRA2]